MAIRMVVCDLLGVLIDGGEMVRIAQRDALAEALPQLRPGVLEGVQGLAIPVAIQTVLEGHGREDLLPRIPSMMVAFEHRFLGLLGRAAPPQPGVGVVDALGILRGRGVSVAVQAALPRSLLDACLERLGWVAGSRPFDASVATDEVARGRPWPEMIDRLRDDLGGIASSDVAAVCDTPVGLQEGIVARCGLVIGVCNGAHGRESLSAHPHDAIVASFADVPDLVAGHDR